MSHVLIVDDEESICWGLSRLLREDGHSVATAASAEDALAAVSAQRPDIAVLDVRLPGQDGLSAMESLFELAGQIPVVVITAFGNLNTAVSAFERGAFEYLPKPFDLEQATAVINRALEHARASRGSKQNRPRFASGELLLGGSAAMQEVFKRIALVASTESPVLICGESGTGKELVARAIHRHSRRGEQAFVPVNLAALSPTLIESELFGHVRGAFTGADQSRPGLLEMASGGTVLFDEAGDIPLSVQVKLLRVLEQREITPIGTTEPRATSFRVLAATNRDLRQHCALGSFREDLYYRLAVVEIRMPPLRERPEDIPLLANHFVQIVNEANGWSATLAKDTVHDLMERPWWGNIRELRNAVESAALMARGGPVAPEHLPPAVTLQSSNAQTPSQRLRLAVRQWAEAEVGNPGNRTGLYEKFLAAAEPSLFEVVLDSTNLNRASAADMLGIHRATLRKKMNERRDLP
jgi:two-component system nitrogen regulation response regulator GlnG